MAFSPLDAANAPLTNRAKTFYDEQAVLIRYHPDLLHSARLPPLPSSVDGFRDKATGASIPLTVHSIHSVFDGNQAASRDVNQMNAYAAIRAVAESIRPNPLDSMIGFTFILPLPVRGGLSVNAKELFMQAYGAERELLDSGFNVRSVLAVDRRKLLVFERELYERAARFYRRAGVVPGYRNVVTQVHDYRRLLASHEHHTVFSHERFQQIHAQVESFERSVDCVETSPLPALFGTRHNCIAPYVDLVLMAPSGIASDHAMSILVRVVLAICVQFFAIANGRFFERDPTSAHYDASKPPFLVMIFMDCDAYTNIRRSTGSKKRAASSSSSDSFASLEQDKYWLGQLQLTSANVYDAVVRLPFRLFVQKVFETILPQLGLGEKTEALRKKVEHMLHWNLLKNTKQNFMTTGFMPVDLGAVYADSINAAYRDARVPNAEDQPFSYAYKKCFVTNSSVEMNHLARPEKHNPELVCDRLLASFFSHASMTPYAPIFVESLEDRLAKLSLMSAFGTTKMNVFPLVDQPLALSAIDDAKKVQYIAHKLEMQNRAMVRAARFVTREDLFGLRETLCEDFKKCFPGAVVQRPYFLLTSQACLLPTLAHELISTPDVFRENHADGASSAAAAGQPQIYGEDVTDRVMEVEDFHVRQEQRRHVFLQQLRYCFFINQSQFCAFIPALHMAYEEYPDYIKNPMQEPMEASVGTVAFGAERAWMDSANQGYPTISPVYSLTTSAFYSLYLRGAARVGSNAGISYGRQPNRMLIGITSHAQHSLVYNPTSSAHDEKEGWKIGSYAVGGATHHFAVRLYRGNIDVPAVERAVHLRALVDLLRSLHGMTKSHAWVRKTVGVFYKDCVKLLTEKKTMQKRQESASFESNVLAVYRLLHYFFTREEDVVYSLVRVFEADEPSVLNNANGCSYSEGGFRMPPFMALLHRALLRAHYADAMTSKQEIRTAKQANYGNASQLLQRESVHPLQTTLEQCLMQWDTCGVIRPSAKVLSGAARCEDLLHLIGFPKAVYERPSRLLETVPIAQAMAFTVLFQFESMITTALNVQEALFWESLADENFGYALVACKDGLFFCPTQPQDSCFSASLRTSDAASDPDAAALLEAVASEGSSLALPRSRRGAWALAPGQFMDLLFATMERRILRPIRRYLYHQTPVDMIRFENGDTWIQRMMKRTTEEPFFHRVFRHIRQTVSTMYQEELHRKRLKRTPKRSRIQSMDSVSVFSAGVATSAAAASSSSSSALTDSLYPLVEMAAASSMDSEEAVATRMVVEEAVEATRTPEGITNLGLLYAISPQDSRLRQDLAGLMDEVNGHMRMILPEAFVSAREAELRLLVHFGNAILLKKSVTPADVDLAVRYSCVLGGPKQTETIGEFVVKRIVGPLCGSQACRVDPLIRARFPPERVLASLRECIPRMDVEDPMIRLFMDPSVFAEVIGAIRAALL